MTITLKEFSKTHLSYETEEHARWRKAFPSELRIHEKFIKRWFWGGSLYKDVLEEKWVRYHKGDIIDIEWRELDRFPEPRDWRKF